MEINTFFDFCSGIGAGRLGLEQCGLKCVGRSDTSRLADTTYKLLHNTDNEINYGNLKRLNGKELPPFDLLIAGFPCQSFSVIGRQDGFNDDRGQIIFQIARILKEASPKCFILENVKGLVTHNNGETLKTILRELNNAGYDTSYRVIVSSDCGIPQMRQRVYFLGFRKDLRLDTRKFQWTTVLPLQSLEDFLIDNDNIPTPTDMFYFEKYLVNPTNISRNYTLEKLLSENYLIIDTRMNDLRLYRGKVPTLRAQRDGIYYVKEHELRYLSGYEALLLQGFPKIYADKVKYKVTNRHLLMQAGNAMTVDVIRCLGNCIIDFFKTKQEGIDMSNWEEFESKSTQYLSEKFGTYADFTRMGGSDSTVPDILVRTRTGKCFYIEAKHSPAQCGQFVLLPNIRTRQFEYSPLNATAINEYSRSIMEYMNMDFDGFREAGTTGKDIDLPNGDSVFAKWIIQIYKEKNVKFFISNNYTIIPIVHFAEYFDISAKYRIKRSGSSSVGISRIKKIKSYIESCHFPNTTISIAGDKIFVTSAGINHNQRFTFEGYEYMFSKRGNEFEIRRLSNTYNANVIFAIRYRGNIAGVSNNDFIAYLRQ